MDASGMKTVGITTGVNKILKAVYGNTAAASAASEVVEETRKEDTAVKRKRGTFSQGDSAKSTLNQRNKKVKSEEDKNCSIKSYFLRKPSS
jgi:hypothetical protein